MECRVRSGWVKKSQSADLNQSSRFCAVLLSQRHCCHAYVADQTLLHTWRQLSWHFTCAVHLWTKLPTFSVPLEMSFFTGNVNLHLCVAVSSHTWHTHTHTECDRTLLRSQNSDVWWYCDVTAIAVAAAAVYSFYHVTCAHDNHAPMQSRVAAVGAEHSSPACLFTQKGRYYCCGVKYRLVKVKV